MELKNRFSEVGDSPHHLERGNSEMNEIDELYSETKKIDA